MPTGLIPQGRRDRAGTIIEELLPRRPDIYGKVTERRNQRPRGARTNRGLDPLVLKAGENVSRWSGEPNDAD